MLYGRAFRAPSALEKNGMFFLTMGNRNLKAETIDLIELTFMYKIKNTLKISANGYYNSWKNGIIFQNLPKSLTPYFASVFTNQGNNRAYGGELSIFYTYRRISIESGYAYVYSEALNVVDPISEGLQSIVPSYPIYRKDHLRYGAYPEHSVNAGIYYTIPKIEVTCFLNNRLYLNMYETQASLDTKVNPKKLPVYHRMDLNISKIIAQKLEIFLEIKNITNRKNYMPSVWGQEGGIQEPGIGGMMRVSYKI
jgi:outer membrane receptor protein involved in Fe transport